MFDGPTLNDMKNSPELREGETVEKVVGTQVGEVIRNNAVVAVTNDRLMIRPKRGRSVPDEEAENASLTIDLDEVEAIRRYGALTKQIEVVCGDETHELPSLPNGSEEVVDAVVKNNGLEKTDWGDGSVVRGTKATVATVIGGLGLLLGLGGILVGLGMTLTLVGLLSGIFTFIGGAFVTKVSWQILGWGYRTKEEYSTAPGA
jgi:hypothetical protein